jgi:hypothetical protein
MTLGHLVEYLLKCFDLRRLFKAEALKIAREAIHQAALVPVELRQSLWVLPGFLVVLQDAVDGLVECDQ